MENQVFTKRETIDRIFVETVNKLTELRIKERFLKRKATLEKSYLQPLGQMQHAIKELADQQAFLEEIREEKEND